MAIEMVNRKIRFVWNNGAGARAIVHNVSLEAAMGGDLTSQVKELFLHDVEWTLNPNISPSYLRPLTPLHILPSDKEWTVNSKISTIHPNPLPHPTSIFCHVT